MIKLGKQFSRVLDKFDDNEQQKTYHDLGEFIYEPRPIP